MKQFKHLQSTRLAVAALTLCAVGAASARATNAAAYSITYVEALPNNGANADSVLKELAAKVRDDPSNLGCAVLRRIGRDEDFALVEIWKDQQSLDANDAAGSTKAAFATLAPLLRSPADERVDVPSVVDVARTRAAFATHDSNYVFGVTHADVIPAVKETGLAATRALVAPSSAEPGNVAYDVLQQASRMNHVTLFEVWKDRKSFDGHEAASGMVAFRGVFRPLSGSLYDQRLYRLAP